MNHSSVDVPAAGMGEAAVRGRWVRFFLAGDSGKTRTFRVEAAPPSRAVLGSIRWHGAWRCYAFFPEVGTLFEARCLRDIARFCEDLTVAQRAGSQRAPAPVYDQAGWMR